MASRASLERKSKIVALENIRSHSKDLPNLSSLDDALEGSLSDVS